MKKQPKVELKRFIICRSLTDDEKAIIFTVTSYTDAVEALTDYVEIKKDEKTLTVELLDEKRMNEVVLAGVSAILAKNAAKGIKPVDL